jgi:voltage-gated potassium channel
MTLAMPQSRLHLTPYQRVRRRAYEIMEGAVVDKYSRSIEVFVATLVVANVIAIILESVPEILQPHAAAFHAFDVFSVAVFTLEYLLRVWSCGAKYDIGKPATPNGQAPGSWRGRKEYVFSFYGIVDFVSTVPFYLQLLFPAADLRVLRLFRCVFSNSRATTALLRTSWPPSKPNATLFHRLCFCCSSAACCSPR